MIPYLAVARSSHWNHLLSWINVDAGFSKIHTPCTAMTKAMSATDLRQGRRGAGTGYLDEHKLLTQGYSNFNFEVRKLEKGNLCYLNRTQQFIMFWYTSTSLAVSMLLRITDIYVQSPSGFSHVRLEVPRLIATHDEHNTPRVARRAAALLALKTSMMANLAGKSWYPTILPPHGNYRKNSIAEF